MHWYIFTYIHTYVHTYARVLHTYPGIMPSYVLHSYLYSYTLLCIRTFVHAYMHTDTYARVYILTYTGCIHVTYIHMRTCLQIFRPHMHYTSVTSSSSSCVAPRLMCWRVLLQWSFSSMTCTTKGPSHSRTRHSSSGDLTGSE